MRGANGDRPTLVAGLPVGDLVVSALLALAGVVTALEMEPPEGPAGLTVAVAVAMAAATAWRRRAPFLSLVVAVGAGQVQSSLAVSPGSVWAFAVLLLACYSAARYLGEGRAALAGGILIASLWLQEWQDGDSDYLFIAVVFGGVWLFGRTVRQWQHRAHSAEQNQELLARTAVAEERIRIARELHDVVAHSLSVVSVQANAAEAALDHDAGKARDPLAAIKASTREALDEMRRLLFLLRTEDDGSSPQLGLAALDDLVVSVRAAGLQVEVETTGSPVPLPAGVDVSAYRILQEALTNVLKHADGAPTRVEVSYEDDAVTLIVVNAPSRAAVTAERAGSGGHGLIGVRERVVALGGDLATGSRPDGGFSLSARLPLTAVS